MNPPSKHHYIPEFLLKEWCGNDGKLCQFSRPNNSTLKPLRVFPSQTGFERNLYSLRGFGKETAGQVEEIFFKPLDCRASTAMRKLKLGKAKISLTAQEITSWSTFLLSLMLRMPEDIEALRLSWGHRFRTTTPEMESRYAEIRKDDDPKSFRDYLTQLPSAHLESGVFETLMMLHEDSRSVHHFNKMLWTILDLSCSRFELFLSDRPIFQTDALSSQNGTIFLPIGPKHLFMAANSIEPISKILICPKDTVVRDTNRIVVSQARLFAYATSDEALRFMQNNFASETPQRATANI